MFRAQCCAVLGCGLMLVATTAEARELELSVENRIGGDNNVFRSSSDRTADGFYSISPRVVVREANSKLNYVLSYRPTYESFFTTSGIDGFDHQAQGVLSWRPNAVDDFGLRGNFSNRRSLSLEDQGGPSDPVPILEGTDRERTQVFFGVLSYDRALSSVFSVQASITIDDLDFSREGSFDSRGYSGRLGTQYVLDPITVVGLSGTFRKRESSAGGLQFSTETETWDVAVSIQRRLTPTLDLSLQAGPSFTFTEQKPPFPGFPDIDSRSTSFFAALSLDKTWQRSNFSASYTRSQTSGGTTLSTAITDSVRLTFSHRFDRQWSFRIFGSWLQSSEIEEVPGARNQDTTQYSASTSLTRRINPRLSVVGQFSYFVQDQNETIRSESIGDIFTGSLSLRYTFAPVVF